ncbi:MAG: amidohydrolase [Elusimicrobiota bacterium]|jgi:amidohydrolase|nr:amidohydrolase [Elusimicrobiota bacterium]
MNSEIKSLSKSIEADMIRWRRHFHENPECSFQEYQTVDYIKKELENLPNIEISRLTPTSLQILVKGGGAADGAGKRIALRADIDALPVEEKSGEPFSSKNKGRMHACGHDFHTAILMGAVKIASQLSPKIKGEVLFIFQHAEELPPGGGIELVKAGVLNNVDMVFALHADPTTPVGIVNSLDGVYCASTDNFSLLIKGRGAHGSMPQKSIDPIVIGSQIVDVLQTIVSRRMDPFNAPVVTVATFKADGEFNIIPDNAYLAGTLRTHDKNIRQEIQDLVDKTIKGITDIYGAQYEFKIIKGYPVGINDSKALKVCQSVFDDYLSPDYQLSLDGKPMFGGEDFAYYQEKVPGCFMFFGAGRGDFDKSAMLHSSKLRLNEDALQVGVSIHIGLIYKLLL